ncbi:MAG TPA: DUF58 domain-containing protein [Candidatus Limnocylindrales bacterium]|nr:DUF58 domain-containing protein [Candidatus Limnocylindrales bacterium]
MSLARAVDRADRDPALPASVVRRIRALEIKARILADEALLGTYRSVFRGSGLEFEEVREYEAGDDIRSIDWNVTARMGTPYIKKFREDRELSIFLAVDSSASSWFGSVAQSKRELGAEVAALLALTAMTNNDRVGLLRFASGMQEWLPSSHGRDHLLRMIRALLFATPRRDRTELSAAARFLTNVTKKRSVVFLISDFIDVDIDDSIRMLGRKHDVVAIILDDPRERELPNVGVVALEDAETGRTAYVDTSDRRLRSEYAASAMRRRIERRRALGRMKIDSLELHTDRPYVPALMAFFNARTKRA